MKKRRKAKENPIDTGTALFIGGGVVLLGVAAYFIFRTPPAATSTTTSQLPTAATAPTPGSVTDPNSVAYACNMARKLAASHPTTAGARKLRSSEYAYWSGKCAAGGGTV